MCTTMRVRVRVYARAPVCKATSALYIYKCIRAFMPHFKLQIYVRVICVLCMCIYQLMNKALMCLFTYGVCMCAQVRVCIHTMLRSRVYVCAST